jgi:tRNA pseudouridine38-40 synthase
MVRNIVGSLIETGGGNLDESGWRELLAGRAGKAGPTAPAKGLFLVSVEYAADGGKPGSGLL